MAVKQLTRRFLATVLLAAVLGTLALPTASQRAAATERRIALVIGNGAYTAASQLANPANDAAAVSGVLRQLGFEVIEVVDGDIVAMRLGIRRFGKRLPGADVGVFFYAGHGLQVGGTNYLLPTTAELHTERDLPFEAVPINLVMEQMDASGARVKIVILDACRDNPLARSLARAIRGGGRSTVVGRGLARIEGAAGSMIAFATAPGDIAADGVGVNSPFTSALLDHMVAPGLEVAQMFRRVRMDVMEATGEDQVPWVNEALVGEFFFNPAADAEPAARREETDWTQPGSSADLAYWNSIEDSADPADYQAYLRKFPNGLFADLARRRAYPPTRLELSAEPEPEPEPEPGRPEDDKLAVLTAPVARTHPMDGAYEGKVKRDWIRDPSRAGECIRGKLRFVVAGGDLQFYLRGPISIVGLGSDKARAGMRGEISGEVEDDGTLRDVMLVMKMLGMDFAKIYFTGTVTKGTWRHQQRLCGGSYQLEPVDSATAVGDKLD